MGDTNRDSQYHGRRQLPFKGVMYECSAEKTNQKKKKKRNFKYQGTKERKKEKKDPGIKKK